MTAMMTPPWKISRNEVRIAGWPLRERIVNSSAPSYWLPGLFEGRSEVSRNGTSGTGVRACSETRPAPRTARVRRGPVAHQCS